MKAGPCSRTSLKALQATCLGTLLSAAACDFTEPQWEVDLILPFNSDTIGFEDVLPPVVSIGDLAGTITFVLSTITDTTRTSLGQACGSPCGALQGQTVPVPGFSHVDTVEIGLGSDLLAVEISDGTLTYLMTHDLGFDLLRPHLDPGTAGSITLVTTSVTTGELLDSTVISGANANFPSGGSLTGFVDLTDTRFEGGLRTIITIDSPFDGQTATVDTAAQLTSVGLLLGAFANSIRIVVDSDTIKENYPIDLPPEIREKLIEDLLPGFDNFVQTARLVVEVKHGINVSGGLDLLVAEDTVAVTFVDGPDEIVLEDIDISTAPNGRIVEREITADDVLLIAESEELFAVYQAVVTGTEPGISVTLTPDAGMLIKLTISARLRLQP